MRERKGGAGGVDAVGGVFRVLVLSVYGTFFGIVTVLWNRSSCDCCFFPPILGCSLSGLTRVHSMELSALIQ